MIHVYKQSREPINAFDIVRVGGPNNIAPDINAHFLVLWDAHAMKRGDTWHYIFDFDTRDSLQMSELACVMAGGSQALYYKNAADWKSWLGDSWRLVDEKARWDILHPLNASDAAQTSITDIRVGGGLKPMPE